MTGIDANGLHYGCTGRVPVHGAVLQPCAVVHIAAITAWTAEPSGKTVVEAIGLDHPYGRLIDQHSPAYKPLIA